MSSVVLDITSRGLHEAQQNVHRAGELITAGTANTMLRWYNKHMKKTMLNIIKTGEGVPNNVGRYALEKEALWGISHGLGVMTGGLYFSVSMVQPTVKETRGKEVRFAIRFDDPYYVAYVIDGTSRHIGRDFPTIAKDKEWKKLLDMVGKQFDKLDFTLPYPQLMNSILGPGIAPSLRSFG